MKKNITMRLEASVIATLQERAKKDNRTLSDYLRNLIDKYLKGDK